MTNLDTPLLNSKQLGFEFVASSFPDGRITDKTKTLLIKNDLLIHPSVDATPRKSNIVAYFGNRQVIQDSFIPVKKEEVLNRTVLPEVQEHFLNDEDLPWFARIFRNKPNTSNRTSIKGTHEYFLSDNPAQMALIQPDPTEKGTWRVHPLLAILTRLTQGNYGPVELTHTQIPPSLEQHFPSIAHLIRTVEVPSGMSTREVITPDQVANKKNAKKIIVPALKFASELKPSFPEGLTYPIIKVIQKHL